MTHPRTKTVIEFKVTCLHSLICFHGNVPRLPWSSNQLLFKCRHYSHRRIQGLYRNWIVKKYDSVWLSMTFNHQKVWPFLTFFKINMNHLPSKIVLSEGGSHNFMCHRPSYIEILFFDSTSTISLSTNIWKDMKSMTF